MRYLWFLTISLLSAHTHSDYRFTLSNPAFGASEARYVIEYFTASDCVACREFEIDHQDMFRASGASSVRWVFRELPSEAGLTAGLTLFCTQSLDDYFERRLASRRAEKLPLPRLSRMSADRYQQCMEGTDALAIAEHNAEVFSQSGFVGTPAFRIHDRHTRKTYTAQSAGSLLKSLSTLGVYTMEKQNDRSRRM